ncbi:hypothetical protein PILCRDRAFT_812477 [Piloderma croceum F 1598]|uniref:Uncharacterized protein n=1 Tax=Piloderma croceum (strain F 1598) TaxID=765440 RepID=A0A0C3GD86_PILCF|nr:hypothetical protein PILCRDRAFT_812477 [Piloderma croceum F 1598]
MGARSQEIVDRRSSKNGLKELGFGGKKYILPNDEFSGNGIAPFGANLFSTCYVGRCKHGRYES